MSDTEEPTSTPRAGSGADVARRMDRMEGRQDRIETRVDAIATAVARVESSLDHAGKINEIQYATLKDGLAALQNITGEFIKRIEGILDGSIQTAQAKQGAELVADFVKWRKEVDGDLTALKAQNQNQRSFNAGIGQTFGTAKATIVTVAACITAGVAIYSVLQP